MFIHTSKFNFNEGKGGVAAQNHSSRCKQKIISVFVHARIIA